jgi:hypothetical protein
MSKKRTIEITNIVINFGDKGLLDNLQEKVYPALCDKSLRGKGEVSSYKLLGLKVAEIGTPLTPTLLERDLKYRGLLSGDTSYQSELIGILIGT